MIKFWRPAGHEDQKSKNVGRWEGEGEFNLSKTNSFNCFFDMNPFFTSGRKNTSGRKKHFASEQLGGRPPRSEINAM